MSVGRFSGIYRPIPTRFRVRTSWDNHVILIEPAHCLGQGHLTKTAKPERFQGRMTPQARKSAAQVKGIFHVSCFQEPPPTTDGMSAGPLLSTHLADGMPRQQQNEHRLLKDPRIPAPGGNTGREPRAGPPAVGAVKTGNGDRILIAAVRPNPVGFPPILSMEPDTGLATVWTEIRPVGFWIQVKVFKVLLQGRDSWQDTGHRLVSFGFMVRFVTYHDNRG